MKLEDVVRELPGVRVAGPADDDAIVRFFDGAPMGTSSFEVRYQRAPSFFRLLRYQSPRSHVVIAEKDGEVRACATMSVRPGWVDGRPVEVGYLGDLRIAPDRKLLVLWRRVFAKVIAVAAQLEDVGCEHFVTAVMDENTLARAALIARRRDGPVYLPLAPFQMRNVLARVPFWPRERAFRARRATVADLDRVRAFWEESETKKRYGWRGDLDRRLVAWDDFSIASFVLVEDRSGALAAMAAPWSPSKAKSTLVTRMPRGLELAAAVSKMPGSPIRLPRTGERMGIQYLTHLAISDALDARGRELALDALLDRALADRGDAHFVALPEFAAFPLGNAPLGNALRPYIVQSLPITLYTVHPPGSDPAPITLEREPGFEMALV